MSYDERKRVKIEDTEIILSAVASGNSVGGSVLKMEFNKLFIFYAIELNDKVQ